MFVWWLNGVEIYYRHFEEETCIGTAVSIVSGMLKPGASSLLGAESDYHGLIRARKRLISGVACWFCGMVLNALRTHSQRSRYRFMELYYLSKISFMISAKYFEAVASFANLCEMS